MVFVGSPLEADAKTLVRVGKQLKKNGIAVDVVSLGEVEDNKDKLQVSRRCMYVCMVYGA